MTALFVIRACNDISIISERPDVLRSRNEDWHIIYFSDCCVYRCCNCNTDVYKSYSSRPNDGLRLERHIRISATPLAILEYRAPSSPFAVGKMKYLHRRDRILVSLMGAFLIFDPSVVNFAIPPMTNDNGYL